MPRWPNWFKKRKKSKVESQPLKREDLNTLIAKLKEETMLLNWLGKNKVTESELKELRDLEEKIVDLLTDDFQKKVFRILLKHNIGLLEFLEGDWKEILRQGYKNIADYLDPEHPLNFVGKKLPVKGRDFLFWLLKQAKPVDSANRYKKIAETIKKGEICGCKISDERLVEQIASIVGVVLMSKEYSRQFRILMEIMSDLEGGEQFIKENLFS